MYRLFFIGIVVVFIGCVVDDIFEGLVFFGVVGFGVVVWGFWGVIICEKIILFNVFFYVFFLCGLSEINKWKMERDRMYFIILCYFCIIFCVCVFLGIYIIRLCFYFKEIFYYSLFVVSDF